MEEKLARDHLETRDGARLAVRPIRTDDIDREREFINGLSEEARYNRLMYTMREPSTSMLRQLVSIDQVNTMALIAADTRNGHERFVAVARYARDAGSPSAEFAVVVADAWQGRGIGTRLARILFAHAAEHGIDRIYGTILANNQRMLELAQHLGMTTETMADDRSQVVASLTMHRTNTQ